MFLGAASELGGLGIDTKDEEDDINGNRMSRGLQKPFSRGASGSSGGSAVVFKPRLVRVCKGKLL